MQWQTVCTFNEGPKAVSLNVRCLGLTSRICLSPCQLGVREMVLLPAFRPAGLSVHLLVRMAACPPICTSTCFPVCIYCTG